MAVDNIASWGDTDVFPLPPENHVFYDRPEDIVALLDDIHRNFAARRDANPPINESALAMVGYTSFRWVMQIDPLWNAYLLGLILSIASEIEAARIPVADATVFSYRYENTSDGHRLFADGSWRLFNEQSLRLAEEYPYVLICDIADFYARIYHHRVENSLLFLKAREGLPNRINQVLALLSTGVSYGLPVGGPAARLISEILLNRVDRLLLSNGIRFCRFADDYHIFTESREDAFDALRYLTEKMLQNEGLTLQRAKTRIISARDFIASSDFATRRDDDKGDASSEGGDDHDEAPEHQEQRTFLALSLRYDPYSPTAVEDYSELKRQVEQFDILGMLSRELSKSRVHAALTRRLIRAMTYLEPGARDNAVRILVENMEKLSPVLPNLLRAVTDIWEQLNDDTHEFVAQYTRAVIIEKRYFVTVPVNLAYAIRLLGCSPSIENETLLAQLYTQVPHFVQRDIVLIMARWRAIYWLSDQRNQFSRMHPWVQRAFLIASYVLEDEGEHWRRRIAGQLSPFDTLVSSWAKERTGVPGWEVPL